MNKLLFILTILLFVTSCSREDIQTQEHKLELDNCKDFSVRSYNAKIVNLSDIIYEDYKPIVRLEKLPEAHNKNKISFIRDVQIGNSGGKLKGYIILTDNQDDLTINNNLLVNLDIYQIESLNRNNKTLLYRASENIKTGNLITYRDKGNEKSVPAYYIEFSINDFFINPTKCLGELNLSIIGEDNLFLNTAPIILFTDYEKPADKNTYKEIENAEGHIILTGDKSNIPNLTKMPFLWVIENKKPSYLFGTIHSSEDRVITLPDSVIEAINQSDVIYIEIDPEELTSPSSYDVFLQDDLTLEKLLPQDILMRLDKYMVSKGESILKYHRYKVWFINSIIERGLGKKETEKKPILDIYITNLGKDFGKDIKGIESLKEQHDIYDNLKLNEQISLLNSTLTRLESVESEINEGEKFITDLYILGDESMINLFLTGYSKTEVESKVLDRLLKDRNKKIAYRIDELIKSNPNKSFFIAVGVAHYPQEEGIIDLLRDSGYEINRVEFKNRDLCNSGYLRFNGRCYYSYVENQ